MSALFPEPKAIAGPPGHIVIVCFAYAPERQRRQPWAVARGLAEGLVLWGHSVTLITDQPVPEQSAGVQGLQVEPLFRRGRPSHALRQTIEHIDPDQVFVFTGGWQLCRARAMDWRAVTHLVMASPRLTPREVLAPGWRLLWRERRLLALPLLNSLLPGRRLRAGFRRSRADSILYLSSETQRRFMAAGLPRGERLRPQVRPFASVPPCSKDVDDRGQSAPLIAYLGPPIEMRGAYLALRCFEDVVARGFDAHLLMLLRPDGDPELMRAFLQRLEQSPCRGRIRHETAMLSGEQLDGSVAAADVFLLPFRAPVSEVPLVVLEAGLSGRPVVVLKAPSVTEYAEELGGVVAEDVEQLPDALAHALRHGLQRRPDRTRWGGWKQAVEPWKQRPRRPLPAYRMLALCGVDGSGKTFLLEHLGRELELLGLRHEHVWSRFRNYTSRPLLALARLTGHNRKVEAAGARIGYHDFQHTPWLAWPFLILQLVDQLIDIAIRFRWPFRHVGAPIILADRCVIDTLVDWAVDTGMDDLVIDRLGPSLMRLLPSPRLIVVIRRPIEATANDRPDALAERHFLRRRALYQRIATSLALPVIDNDGLAEDAIDDLLAQVDGLNPRARDQDHDLRVL